MKKRWIATIVATAAGILLCTSAWFWFDHNYLVVEGTLYPKAADEVILTGKQLPEDRKFWEMAEFKTLDARQVVMDIAAFEALRAAMPDTEILWNVPLGDGYFENTATEVRINSLMEDELRNLKYLPKLQVVDARGCSDFHVLELLMQYNSDLKVLYTVNVGTQQLREDTTQVTVSDDEISALMDAVPQLPQLELVDATGCTEYELLMQMRQLYPDLDIRYQVSIDAGQYSGDVEELKIDRDDMNALEEMLPYLPNLTKVVLNGTFSDSDEILALAGRWPNIIFDWEFQVCGVSTRSTSTELVLSGIFMESTDMVESALKYFYHLERVEMCDCGIPSVNMDALGQRHPETRFVWSVNIGWGKLRTDATAFIPFKLGYHIDRPFYDEQAQELKYCIDLECLDLGHMRMYDISFLQYMPKLKYLIVADTDAHDYSVIGQLTDLIYLEIFLTPLNDAEFLLNLTKLQNLNIAWTPLQNPEVLMEMTWLERLWATECGLTEEQSEQLKQALPNAVVYTTSKHPTEGGWRQDDLYYKMRDLLEMGYME